LPVLPLVIAGAMVMAILLGGAWLWTTEDAGPATVPRPPELMVLIDRSDHMQAQTGDACVALERTLDRYMDPVSPAFALRDKRTRIEVYLTPETPDAPPAPLMTLAAADFMVGAGLGTSTAAREEAERLRAKAVEDTLARCRSQATPTTGGSIHGAMAALVAELAARCEGEQRCELVTYSDLHDPTSPWLCAHVFGEEALRSGGVCPQLAQSGDEHSGRWPADAVPAVTPADGVEIRVCGIADSRVSGAATVGPRAAKRRKAVWSGLFPGSALEILHHCELL
ncbi:MAG: hypothetical protein VX000_13940, partial [Myxococcota bacterium]|nr:hypothetical protein [Myxococcota bacterium]